MKYSEISKLERKELIKLIVKYKELLFKLRMDVSAEKKNTSLFKSYKKIIARAMTSLNGLSRG
jgi:ribosomal protein L29